MKSIAAIALVLGAHSSTVHASAAWAKQPPVEYRIPASWKPMKISAPAGKDRGVIYEIPESGNTRDRPLVVLKAYKLPSGMRMDNINLADVAKAVIPAGAPVSEAADGPSWRTCLFIGHIGNAKLLALYRIGIKDGYVAEETFIFPIPTTKSEDLALLTIYGQADQEGRTTGVYAPLQSTYKIISLFNEFTKTLGINGQAPFSAKAIMARPSEKPTAAYRLSNFPRSARSVGG